MESQRYLLVVILTIRINGPRRKKTFWGLPPGQAQLQRLARMLKFCMKQVKISHFGDSE